MGGRRDTFSGGGIFFSGGGKYFSGGGKLLLGRENSTATPLYMKPCYYHLALCFFSFIKLTVGVKKKFPLSCFKDART